jgi:hypothetical protein
MAELENPKAKEKLKLVSKWFPTTALMHGVRGSMGLGMSKKSALKGGHG